MRLRRRRVIFIAGALVIVWMVIVLLTPPPSTSQSNRRSEDDGDMDNIVPDNLRTSYKAVKGNVREQEPKYAAKEFADFEDFQPDGALQNNESRKANVIIEKHFNNETVNKESALLDIEKDLIPKNLTMVKTNPSAIWNVAASWVKSLEIHPEIAPELGDVLHGLSTVPIIEADVGYKGTQLKARFMLQGGQMVVFKPKRFTRDHVIYGKPYAGYDRHNGEIASFHLDRVLGLRRAPLVAGRTVNLRTEIKPVATRLLLDTFITKDNNTCFYGKCFYCRPEEPACADGEVMEGSITLWLPKDRALKKWHHLWSRTYKEGKKARWEVDNTYCSVVLGKYPLDKYPLVLDMIDAAVFDYLIGNADRHQYETFQEDGDQGMLLLLDNAKSFGNPIHDEKSILAPLYQCCRLRRTLWAKLQSLRNGALSNVMRQVLSHDRISPVLTEKHLAAMDRRLGHIVTMVKTCFKKHGEMTVLQ